MNPKKLQPDSPDARLDAWVTDNELVHRTKAGDIQAYEELFKRHHKRVFNIAMGVLSDEADAADITQDVFVRAHQAIGSLKADDAFAAWLKVMTINRCRDILRRRGRLRVDSLDAQVERNDGSSRAIEIPDFSNNPENSLDKKLLRDSVRNAIATLSPDAREVVTLFYIDGADVASIAKILKSPEGTIKSRLSRARAELKRKLAHHIVDDGF